MRLPKIVPPRTIVRLVKGDKTTPGYRGDIGKQYRIGYYLQCGGLDDVWLVDDNGKYFSYTDREDIAKNYVIEKLSDERDYFGKHRPVLRPRTAKQPVSRKFLPPLTLLRLKAPVRLRHLRLIGDEIGEYFQVGYYTPNDGLETIWIVNEDGKYIGTIERRRLLKYFRVSKLSKEQNYCGLIPIPPLPEAQRLEALRMREMFGNRSSEKEGEPKQQ